jgi:hypothetical protein
MTAPLRSDPLRFDESAVAAKAALLLLEARAKEAGHELAATDAGEEVLHFLAVNGATATRRAVAANPAAGAKTNLALTNDREECVRACLAEKIGRLLPGLFSSEKEHLRELTLATLNALSHDKASAVRAALSEAVKHLDCVPKPIVQRLALHCPYWNSRRSWTTTTFSRFSRPRGPTMCFAPSPAARASRQMPPMRS